MDTVLMNLDLAYLHHPPTGSTQHWALPRIYEYCMFRRERNVMASNHSRDNNNNNNNEESDERSLDNCDEEDSDVEEDRRAHLFEARL